MITTKNYFTEIDKFGVKKLPEELKKSHDFFDKVTQTGASLKAYETSDTIKRMVDLYITKLNAFVGSNKTKTKATPVKQVAVKKTVTKKVEVKKSAVKVTTKKVSTPVADFKNVEKIDESVVFIKRYIGLHGKEKTESQILNFISGLQKAIIEKRISKSSPYAKEIQTIQDSLIKCYSAMKGSIKIKIDEKSLAKYTKIATSESQYTSVKLLKRYFGIQGSKATRDKARNLFNDFIRAGEKGLIGKEDKYYEQMRLAYKHLYDYKSGKIKSLKIDEQQLNGFKDFFAKAKIATQKAIVVAKKVTKQAKKHGTAAFNVAKAATRGAINEGKKAHKNNKYLERKGELGNINIPAVVVGGLIGRAVEKSFEKLTKPALNGVMTVGQIKKETFDRVGLNDKWKALLGDICKPTSLMFYGLGGSKKSTGALRLAEHLNQLGNKILYVAAEQYGTPTFQNLLEYLKPKVNDDTFKIVPNLDTLNPANFDFIVIDSKESSGFKHSDQFEALKKMLHKQSFILTSKAIKNGGFKGDEGWRNVVDTMVKFESGVAKTDDDKNRWGGSGTLTIE